MEVTLQELRTMRHALSNWKEWLEDQQRIGRENGCLPNTLTIKELERIETLYEKVLEESKKLLSKKSD